MTLKTNDTENIDMDIEQKAQFCNFCGSAFSNRSKAREVFYFYFHIIKNNYHILIIIVAIIIDLLLLLSLTLQILILLLIIVLKFRLFS